MIRIPRSELASIVTADAAAVPASDRDEMAIPSYLHPNPLIRALMWRRYAAIESLMRSTREESVLEFGCGTGLFLPTLCQGHSLVYATDLFPQFARELTKRRNLAVTFVEEVEALEDGSLGSIIAADVLEHVDDLPRYLDLFRVKLREGGELLISGPTENSLYKLGRLAAGFGGKGGYHHRNVGDIARAASASFHRTGLVSLPLPFGPRLFEVYRFQLGSEPHPIGGTDL